MEALNIKEEAIEPLIFSNNPLLIDNDIFTPVLLDCTCGEIPRVHVSKRHRYELTHELCGITVNTKERYEAYYSWNHQCLDLDDNCIYDSIDLSGVEVNLQAYGELDFLIKYRDSGDREFLKNQEMKMLKCKILYWQYVIRVNDIISNKHKQN